MKLQLDSWCSAVVVACSLVVTPLGSFAADLRVALDGSAPYSSVQDAIDAAEPGDTVLVAPGEYVVDEPIEFRGPIELIVRSEQGAVVTTLRMSDTPTDPLRRAVLLFQSGETRDTRVEGFTITGGGGMNESEDFWMNRGGGIVCRSASPTIDRCVIERNLNAFGGSGAGGIWGNAGASPKISECVVRKNSGGVGFNASSAPELIDCVIEGNVSETAGGVLIREDSPATFLRCRISGNQATRDGGGVRILVNDTRAFFTDCLITGNRVLSGQGGGVTVTSGAALFDNCVIAGNRASDTGGGIWTTTRVQQIRFRRCTITQNSAVEGGGVYCVNRSALVTTFEDSIIWENEGGSIFDRESNRTAVSYSCVQGGFAGEGNVSDDPRFCWGESETLVEDSVSLTAALSDFRVALSESSPCLGTAAGGGNMGFDGGICSGDLPDRRVIRLAAGEYELNTATVPCGVELVGDSQQTTTLNGSIAKLSRGSGLSHLTLAGGSDTGVRIYPGDDAQISDCTLRGHTGVRGGALYLDENASVSLERTSIIANHAARNGGALFLSPGASAVLAGCHLAANRADRHGGALYVDKGAVAQLTRTTLAGHSAGIDGGAIYFAAGPGSAVSLSTCKVTGNRAEDDGGAVFLRSGCLLELFQTTLATNSAGEGGGGILAEASSELRIGHSILWENQPVGLLVDSGATVALEYSVVEGGGVGHSIRSGDPLFVEPGHWDDAGTPEDRLDDSWVQGDYRLLKGSAAIEAGSVEAVASPDLDGEERPCGTVVDAGAYEFCGDIVVVESTFRRGDADSTGELDLNDAVRSLNFLFLGTMDPTCLDALDFDDSGVVDLMDPVGVLEYLFLGAAGPPAPGLDCAADPTEDELDCRAEPGCG